MEANKKIAEVIIDIKESYAKLDERVNTSMSIVGRIAKNIDLFLNSNERMKMLKSAFSNSSIRNLVFKKLDNVRSYLIPITRK